MSGKTALRQPQVGMGEGVMMDTAFIATAEDQNTRGEGSYLGSTKARSVVGFSF